MCSHIHFIMWVQSEMFVCALKATVRNGGTFTEWGYVDKHGMLRLTLAMFVLICFSVGLHAGVKGMCKQVPSHDN